MKEYTNRYMVPVIMITLMIFITGLFAQISTTKHNLSTSGPGTVKSIVENEICLFCHAPHNAARVPLWNRYDPGTTYQLYASSTMNATVGQPDGTSIMCLSCHDGTVALGSIKSRPTTISFGSNTYMPVGTTNLGTDLRNDHPVSFIYSAALAAADGQLRQPTSLSTGITLQNSKVQCTSCHDPHKNATTDFLVLTSQSSVLCVGCHSKTGWSATTHNTSTRTWNGSGTDPWFHTPPSYTTVQDNGCENCHNPHNAAMSRRILNFATDEANCIHCHGAYVAIKNLRIQFLKPYRHFVDSYDNIHDPTESNMVTTKHVECTDCHNPHQSTTTTAVAPYVNGHNVGVKGIDTDGNDVNPALYQYQICYRCHSTSPWRPASPTSRQIEQNNLMLEFDPGAISYHPVESAGVSDDVPSLLTPWSTTSIMYCTDCHASNGNGAAVGPHGSNYPHILVKQYVTTDYTPESAAVYALCYDCHSRTSILADVTFARHSEHIVGETAPCNICHDPHGISSSQGNTTNNSRLMNFNTSVVSAYNGILRFRDLGYRTGDCTLVCHGVTHINWSY